ncbi:MAG: c-type cytochrome [Janthinobacterium lividum]
MSPWTNPLPCVSVPRVALDTACVDGRRNTYTLMQISLACALSLGTATCAYAQDRAPSEARGDSERGALIFKKRCAQCHTIEAPGTNKAGPWLFGLSTCRAGSVPGFAYSDANRLRGIVWDESTLMAFLADPKAFMPGTRMVFGGLKKRGMRADLVAYLQSNSADGQCAHD